MKIYKILHVKYDKTYAVPEKEIQKEIINHLKKMKYVYYKIESVGVPTSAGTMRSNSHKGFSDLMIIKEDETYFVEIKALNGTLSPHQKKFLLSVQNAHNFCGVVCSLNGLLNCFGDAYVGWSEHFEGINYYV